MRLERVIVLVVGQGWGWDRRRRAMAADGCHVVIADSCCWWQSSLPGWYVGGLMSVTHSLEWIHDAGTVEKVYLLDYARERDALSKVVPARYVYVCT